MNRIKRVALEKLTNELTEKTSQFQVGGCAIIDDELVYLWIAYYFKQPVTVVTNDFSKEMIQKSKTKQEEPKKPQNINQVKSKKIVRKEFEKRAIEEAFLEMTIKDVQFILPKEANDLIEEGKSLKHCVGGSSYINQHADGRTTIVFARKTAEPDKPYYTIEYRGSRLIQVSGWDNKKPDEQLRKVVNQWLHIVNERAKTKEKKHVA